MIRRGLIAVLVFLWGLGSALVWVGCEVESADSVVRTTEINFSGRYDQVDASTPFVSPPNSGRRVTYLILRQTGDQLEAVDNNNIVFRGSIGRVAGGVAEFTLQGHTTVGEPVTISGTLSGEGNTALMQGTWIEPSVYAWLLGDAQITPMTNAPTTLRISPSGTISLPPGSSREFTASGGTGVYAWSLADGNLGTLSSLSGATVTYTARTNGVQTVTVRSGDQTASCRVNQ